ncbi:hypothetical protein BV25DRAFT_1831839 [Artomyces pyxidatus]|uniref:Uncharacterized protein n=1 Tax=Artomyces pyxidatus TaxID=48021 RepID=A0ACB8SLM9_9AGAM|nr:hypothetical protein BV25DRAFT_1831839 [Artomyces pyxidatus]
MPGPGSKKSKAKAKKPQINRDGPGSALRRPGYAPPQNFVDNVYSAEGWDAVVDTLCAMLDLPDVTTRNGLKKIHKDFESVHSKLDDVYAYARAMSRDTEIAAIVQDRLACAVVAVYASMSVDSILRDRVFREADFLAKALPLLDNPSLCHVVLQALTAATHHGGIFVRQEIAKKTSVILQLLDEQPDDAVSAELGISVISHSVGAVVQNEDAPDPKLLKTVDMPRVMRTMLFFVRKPRSSYTLVHHALGFFSGASQHCSKDFHANPSAINLLLACVRTKDIRMRAEGVAAILRLHISDGKPDDTTQDMQKLMAAAGRGWPDHLVEAIMDYGMMRSETFVILTTAREYQKLMMEVVQSGDLAWLGLRLADLIGRTEYSIAQGGWQVEDPRTGKREFQDVGLPFIMWQDALPHCAKALRARGRPSEADPADILDLKWYIMKSRMVEAHAMAHKALERSPHIGFYYYVLTLGAEQADGLRDAKKGLKCPNLTPYVRFGLLYRAAEHAADMALKKLQDAMISGKNLEEGFAFAMSALEDSNTFIREAPPDTRSMKTVIYINTLMMLLVKGNELSSDLKELEFTNAKLKLADDIARFLGRPISQTQMRLARATIVERLPKAWQEWGDVVSRFVDHTKAELSAEKAEDDLTTWLAKLEIGDENMMGHHDDGHRTHPAINLNDVALYRCSWCGNPSAILRKCRGCQKARYCDSDCQKQHWTKSHKKTCAKNHVEDE